LPLTLEAPDDLKKTVFCLERCANFFSVPLPLSFDHPQRKLRLDAPIASGREGGKMY
jgi:hypothetical protein